MSALYIIGNGFDSHHKFKTSYEEYRKYLISKGECERIIAKYPKGDSFWADIETGLRIDYETYINEYLEAYNFEATITREKEFQDLEAITKIHNKALVLKELTSFTGINFYNWLNQSYEEQLLYAKCSPLFQFDKGDYFLTFNYTSTLEDLYSVNQDYIFHIHGQLNKVNHQDLYVPTTIRDSMIIEERHGYVRSALQFGNPYNNPEKMKEKIDFMNILPRNPLFSVEALFSNLDFYLRSSQKNVKANIPILDSFVKSIPYIDIVIIAGCSLGEADNEYYEQILIPRYRNKKWRIYCYSDDDILRADNFVKRHCLDCSLEKW